MFKFLSELCFSQGLIKTLHKVSDYFFLRKKLIFWLLFFGTFVVLLDLICASIISIFYISQNQNTTISIPFFPALVSYFENFSFYVVILIIVILQISREILIFLNSFIPSFITNILERDIKNHLINRFLNKNKKDLDNINKNEIVFKIFNLSPSFAKFITDFIKILTNTFITILYLTSILVYKPIPSMVILTLLILVAVITNKLVVVQQRLGKLYRNNLLRVHDNLNNTFNGVSEIFVGNKKKFFYFFNKKINNKVYQVGNERIKYTNILSPVQRSLSILILGFLLAISEYMSTFGIEFSSLHSSLIIIFLLFRMQAPIVEINNLRSSLFKQKASVDSLADEIMTNHKQKALPIKKSNFSFNDDIQFKKVNFYYGKNKIIKNLNLSIKSGTSCGIIGETGSGKSTLVNLLLKLYEPNSGTISIGDTNLSKIPELDWRKNVSIIPQKGYIFNATIKNNISMFSENCKEKDVIEAAKISGIAGLIETLPKKYNTNIGGKEIELSGGQVQKILIARAVYAKPRILILDEATSAQDAISEEKIMKKIKNIFPNITIIILTHRLSVLNKVERIYCLQKGKIVDRGTWSELFRKKDSIFRKMLNIQMKIKKNEVQ